MLDWINWTYVAAYFIIGTPILLVVLRGIDTEASEDIEIN